MKCQKVQQQRENVARNTQTSFEVRKVNVVNQSPMISRPTRYIIYRSLWRHHFTRQMIKPTVSKLKASSKHWRTVLSHRCCSQISPDSTQHQHVTSILQDSV